MTYPVDIKVEFDFSSGPVFGYPFTIGSDVSGIIGKNTFADNPADTVDISSSVGKISIKRGYNLLQDQFQAGTGTIVIYDPTGYWNPETNPKLVPMRKVRISGNNKDIFAGYTTSYVYTYPKDMEIGFVTVELSDAFRLFALSNITTVTGATAGETTGSRIGKILDTINFPTSMREIDTGDSTVMADPATTRSSLNALKNVEFSEQGAVYVGTGGNIEFHSRSSIQKKSGANPTYFANDGTGIWYRNGTFSFDDKLIINEAKISRIGSSAQSATNSASVAKYFPHSINVTDLVVETDAEALNIARTYVATRAETSVRIDTLTLDLNTPDYAAGVNAALTLDFFDTIKIKSVAQDGSTITKTLQCMGVQHEILPNSWLTTFTTSEPIVDCFQIGSDLYGIIGTSVMTY